MPIANIHILEGRSEETKEELIVKMTETLCEVLKVQPSQVRIIIEEMKPQHYGIAGESVATRRKNEQK